MTKLQQIKTFTRIHGVTLSKAKGSNIVVLGYKIKWTGKAWIGWTMCFEGYNETYKFLLQCVENNIFPWKTYTEERGL